MHHEISSLTVLRKPLPTVRYKMLDMINMYTLVLTLSCPTTSARTGDSTINFLKPEINNIIINQTIMS